MSLEELFNHPKAQFSPLKMMIITKPNIRKIDQIAVCLSSFLALLNDFSELCFGIIARLEVYSKKHYRGLPTVYT